MKLIWHIIKKDLRALRWPLVLWTLLIVMKLGVGVILLTADGTGGDEWFLRLDALAKILASLEALSFILVAAWVQEDMLVGTTAFWVTRPIAGGRLLLAKLLGIMLVFVLWPLIVTLPWWLTCSYGPREIAWAALETAAIHVIVVLVGLLWAVVTDGFGRFLMWTLVMLAAIPAVAAGIGMYLTTHNVRLTGEVATTRILVVELLALLIILVVVVHQYLTRRTVRSVGMIVATVGLMLAVSLWWPWSWGLEERWQAFVTRQLEKDWPVSAESPGLTFAVEGSSLARMVNSRPDRPVQLRVNYHVKGLRADQTLVPSLANQFTLRWPDGQKQQGWSSIRTQGDWYDRVAMPALGLSTLPADSAVQAQIYQMLPAAVGARLQSAPAEYTLKAQFALMEIESTTVVPCQRNEWMFRGSTGERIAHVEREGEELLVTFVRQRPNFITDAVFGFSSYAMGVRRANTSWYPQYLLVNRALGFMDRGSERSKLQAYIGTVLITLETRAYRATKAAKGNRPRLDAIKALDDAEFTKVVYRARTQFSYELKADALVVEPIAP